MKKLFLLPIFLIFGLFCNAQITTHTRVKITTVNELTGVVTTDKLVILDPTTNELKHIVISDLGSIIPNVDAVTIDGIDSSQFLRSDVADVKTSGNLRFQDLIYTEFGDSAEWLYGFDGSNIKLNGTVGDFYIQDNGTTRFTFGRTTGDFTNTGVITSQGTGNSSFLGKLGAGTTTPQGALSVKAGTFRQVDFLDENNQMTIKSTAPDNLYKLRPLSIDSNFLTFRTGLSAITTSTERMRVSESGNVSIGNTNNTYKLDVTGTGRFTDDVIVPDEVYGAGWNASTEVPTKNAVYDKIESLGGGISYTVYTALINQSGTGDPSVMVLENTLGGTLVWTRSGTGIYVGTLVGAFAANKVVGFISNNGRVQGSTMACFVRYATDDTVRLSTYTGTTLADGNLTLASIEIRVYP